MPQTSHSILPAAMKRERFISKPTPYRLARLFVPYLFAAAFATATQAQGTMDFSGAQTLMATFKTFAMYAGAVELSRRAFTANHNHSVIGCQDALVARTRYPEVQHPVIHLAWLSTVAIKSLLLIKSQKVLAKTENSTIKLRS